MVEVNWDVSKTRAEFLAEIANFTRRSHFQLLMARTNQQDFREEYNRYQNSLKTQLMELKGHVLENDSVENQKIRNVEKSFRKIDNNNVSFEDKINDYEKIDEKLQQIRIDLNLDIGTKEEEDLGPEDLYE